MKQNLSRRDFLKIAGVGLGALAFRPRKSFDLEYFFAPKRLPQFPASDIIGRVLENGIKLRAQPTTDESLGTVIAEMPADTLVEWLQRKPHGYVRPSVPRAAFSHCASGGKALLAQRQ